MGISLVFHLSAILVLAVVSFPKQLGGITLDVMASLGVGTETEEQPLELTEFSIASTESDVEQSSAQNQSESLEFSSNTAFDDRMVLEAQHLDRQTDGSASSASDRVIQAMVASTGNGSGSGDFDGSGASFFGIGAGGEKFVFILDSSRSMEGRRWSYAVKELIRAVKDLGPDQKYFVLCFDYMSHPIFDLSLSEIDYLSVNTKTLNRVRIWLRERQLGFGIRPSSSLEIAMQMNPDAIFLLSDGEIRDNSRFLLSSVNRDESGKVKIPIHTILLFSNEGKETLRMIAEENGGTFRAVD